ncbi:hypothetical protein MD484_g4642, partial [Candolleomyces efflorescens]
MSRRDSRTVHFAPTDTHIDGTTPSPTLTSSTLSSPELSSPLPLPHLTLPGSPQSCAFQPWSPVSPTNASFIRTSPPRPAQPMPLDIDEYLRVPPTNQLPHFTFDLTRDPQGMAIKPPIPQVVLDRAAVEPPVAKMSVTIMAEAFQWTVDIKPGPPTNANEKPKEYVTVKDVIFGLYKNLQNMLDDYDQQKMAPAVLEKAKFACQCRRERIKQVEKRDESAGLKRVDLLGKDHRFKGLQIDPRNGNWILRVEEM